MTTILESVRAFMAEEFKGGAANISDLISACQEAESRKDLASIVEDINNQKLKEDATTLLQNGFDEGVEPELISLKLVKLLEEHEGSRNDANLTDINQQREARSKKLESYERNLLGEYYDSGWQEVDSKPVKDWDDFWTDYTWYADATGHHIFIFGDKDIYGPEDTPDHEVEGDYAEAEEWFLSYEGAYDDEDDYEECFSLGKVAEAMAWEDDDYDDDEDWGAPRLSSSTPTDRAGEWSTLRYKSSEDLDEGAEGKQRKGYKWIIYQDEEPYKIVAVRSTHTEAQAYILKHLDKDLTCDEVEEKYAIKGRNYDQDLFEESLNESDLAFKDMYDNVYVEFRDGEPTFAYNTLGDASYGMSMSMSGDIEHDLGSHDYTIMKLEDGVYYPVKGYKPVGDINESLDKGYERTQFRAEVYNMLDLAVNEFENRFNVQVDKDDIEDALDFFSHYYMSQEDFEFDEALVEKPSDQEIRIAQRDIEKEYGKCMYSKFSGDKLYFINKNGDEVSIARRINEETEKLVNKNNGLEYTHRSDTFNGAEYDYYKLGYISRVNCSATTYYKHARGNNGYKYYVKQSHPYDDAEYSWAFSDDGRSWSVVKGRKVVDHIDTQLEDFKAVAEYIVEQDKDVKSKMIHN